MSDDLPIPLNDWILVVPDRMPEVTEGGIHLPETARKSMNHGNVMAVGPGRPVDGLAMDLFKQPTSPHLNVPSPSREVVLEKWPRRPMTVKVGDVIHYPEFAAQFIEAKDGVYALIKEEDVLAVE
jgi:chaperonin GroES